MGPDVVPVGFAATEGPGAPMRRRRRRWVLVLAAILGIGGIAAMAIGIVGATRGAVDVDGRAVVEGEVAALGSEQLTPARFTAPRRGRYTVWLRTDGISLEGNRDTVVAATNCRVDLADGSSAAFRGAVQGSSVVVDDRATVGTFVAPEGEVVVSCRMQPFGRRSRDERLRTPRELVVVPGGPGGGIAAILWILGGSAAVAAGVVLALRERTGGVRPR